MKAFLYGAPIGSEISDFEPLLILSDSESVLLQDRRRITLERNRAALQEQQAESVSYAAVHWLEIYRAGEAVMGLYQINGRSS